MAEHVFTLNSDPVYTRIELTELPDGDFKVLAIGDISDDVWDAIMACHTADMANEDFDLPEGWAMLAIKAVVL